MEGVKPQGRLLDNVKGALRLAWMASPFTSKPSITFGWEVIVMV
jgi:hypothetical protein